MEASRKSLVQGHVMKPPYLSDMGEESGDLEGSRPCSVRSRPASTQPSVLELGEARSRRSMYQVGQPPPPCQCPGWWTTGCRRSGAR